MPRADDLFRPTAVPDPEPDDAEHIADAAAVRVVEVDTTAGAGKPRRSRTSRSKQPVVETVPERMPSGRIKHDEKMTVYITADELLDLEHARLTLRRTLGSAVDRGRIVRAAIAIALADLEAQGEDSQLVRRLDQA
jgi:hypothetical protein